MTEDLFAPNAADRFTFGLWTVGNLGADPFGAKTRAALPLSELLRLLKAAGAYGVNFHDDDLVPFGASAAEKDAIVRDFSAALKDNGLVVPMATTDLFRHPAFKDGAFTSTDPRVRAFALKKSMDAIDLGVSLGAETYVFWGGREGTECDASKDPIEALARMRDAIDFLADYAIGQGYKLRFALEAKPNEPRGDLYLPTTGHMLHFITTLRNEAMVGVNPEVAHETMAGLSFVHGVAQALFAGKLFHIDLNAQRIGRFDQDLRFGSEDLRQAFLLVRLLEGTRTGRRYEGMRHFDAHAFRTEDWQGVFEFAKGCIRNYKILAHKARAFDQDPEVRGLIAEPRDHEAEAALGLGGPGRVLALRGLGIDPEALGRRGYGFERLDQLLIEHLMGVRGDVR